MVKAAQSRPEGVAGMIYATYKDTPGLVDFTVEEVALAEATYREQMTLYGGAFLLNEAETIGALAEFSAAAAHDYLLGTLGLDLPITPEMVTGFIYEAMDAVTSDYRGELYATLLRTRDQMKKRGITTCVMPFAVSREAAQEQSPSQANLPAEFSLSDNYPNPFNPRTTINYSLPVVSRVTLKVFNALGQEVATLVDGVVPAGTHSVTWTAGGFASGLYFYRIQAGSFAETRKMILTK